MLLTVALGLLATAMAVHGGILSSNNRGHRVTLAVYGLLGLLLTIGQGVVIYTEQQEARVDRSRLQDQITTLLNATRLQATLDDVKAVQRTIEDGFARLVAQGALARGQLSPLTAPFEPKPPSSDSPGDLRTEHVRVTQRRAPLGQGRCPPMGSGRRPSPRNRRSWSRCCRRPTSASPGSSAPSADPGISEGLRHRHQYRRSATTA